MGTCFRLFGQVYLALAANSTSHFLAQDFFGNYAIIAFLESLIGWKLRYDPHL